MDVVKEGQLVASIEEALRSEETPVKEERSESLKKGAAAFEAMGKQLIDILKDAPQETVDKVQSGQ